MRSVRKLVASGAALLLATTAFAAPGDEAKTLNQATTVLSEIRNAPDNGIPDGIWNKATCVVVIPGLKKAGFIVGGEFGEGVMSCKNANRWSAPIFMKMTKGSAGLQAGVQSVDVVLVVLNRSGAEKLLNNKVTLGADASIAAGPVGRTASAATDAQLTAEILAYSRAKGLFAGIDLSGGSLRPDESQNERAYGPTASPREIALGTQAVTMSAEARTFTSALGRGTVGTTGVK
jgi:lipid-binding SYLF domain-containing protein